MKPQDANDYGVLYDRSSGHDPTVGDRRSVLEIEVGTFGYCIAFGPRRFPRSDAFGR